MDKKTVPAIFLAISTLLYGGLTAQDNPAAATLFGKDGAFRAMSPGYFLAPSFGLTRMDGSTASLFQLRGGMTWKESFSAGAFLHTSVREIRPQSETLADIYMDYWAAGGFAEFHLSPRRLIHWTFPLYLGYGEVEMDPDEGSAYLDLGESNFFLVEPAALCEVNLHKFVRFNLGAGYRVVGQMRYRNFDQDDLSGFTAYIGLKLGLFR